jgi:hypothetical protein
MDAGVSWKEKDGIAKLLYFQTQYDKKGTPGAGLEIVSLAMSKRYWEIIGERGYGYGATLSEDERLSVMAQLGREYIDVVPILSKPIWNNHLLFMASIEGDDPDGFIRGTEVTNERGDIRFENSPYKMLYVTYPDQPEKARKLDMMFKLSTFGDMIISEQETSGVPINGYMLENAYAIQFVPGSRELNSDGTITDAALQNYLEVLDRHLNRLDDSGLSQQDTDVMKSAAIMGAQRIFYEMVNNQQFMDTHKELVGNVLYWLYGTTQSLGELQAQMVVDYNNLGGGQIDPDRAKMLKAML